MSTVTKITQQKDEKRVNVYLDGKFGFAVTLETAVAHGFKKGQELTEDFIKGLTDKDEEEKVYNRVLRFAMIRPRSEWEIKQWFRRKKVLPGIIEPVFNRLKNAGLVDDETFAKWWIEQRAEFRQKGRGMLGMELRQKGVARDVIERVLEEVDIPEEVELARAAATKKLRNLKTYELKEQKKKLSDFLARRGFSWPTIKRVVADLLEG